jgi:hypothetical protein
LPLSSRLIHSARRSPRTVPMFFPVIHRRLACLRALNSSAGSTAGPRR